MQWRPSIIRTNCLAIESDIGVILIDTGPSIKSPQKTGTNKFYQNLKLKANRPSPLSRRLATLDIDTDSVKHIVLTHLDLAQTQAIEEFPNATAHVFGSEYIAAMAPATQREKNRYAHLKNLNSHPRWKVHQVQGSQWFGFDAIQIFEELGDHIQLIPLVGHTWGHCGVSIKKGQDNWIFHTGDAFFHQRELRLANPNAPWRIKLARYLATADQDSFFFNQERIRKLIQDKPSQIELQCSRFDPKY